ncbi:MAG: hypothetical protein EWV91_09175, partial [Microcystis aeruginosa Ma_QC_Ca_00000000_S207]
PICALSVSLYRFQLLLGVGTLIEFYFKLIICITITEEPNLRSRRRSCYRRICGRSRTTSGRKCRSYRIFAKNPR